LHLAIQAHVNEPTQGIAMPLERFAACFCIAGFGNVKQFRSLFTFWPHAVIITDPATRGKIAIIGHQPIVTGSKEFPKLWKSPDSARSSYPQKHMSREALPEPPVDDGDSAAALEEAFALYQSELLGTLYYLVGNVEDARDALQEAFVKCWRNRQKLKEVENLKAWIFRIALNTGRDLRATAWRRKRQSLDGNEQMIEATQAGPQQAAALHEELTQVREALADLRREEQEVFLLRQNGDMTYDEIGQALGLPTGTVKTRMRLALTKLRQAVAGKPR
jgi:RNA polymerase sigma-70 factor (ECF subfamily)